jgi:hypothetical protein
MEQFIYKVTCKITGCPNSYLEVDVISEGLPENVVCGPCNNQITDISDPTTFTE